MKRGAAKVPVPQGDSGVTARDIPFEEIARESKITGFPVAEQGLQG